MVLYKSGGYISGGIFFLYRSSSVRSHDNHSTTPSPVPPYLFTVNTMPPMPPMSFMSLVTLFDQRKDYSYHQVNAVAEKETELGLAEEQDPSLDQTEYSGDSDDESDHNEMGMTWSTAHSSGSAAPLRLAWVLNAVLLIALVVCYRSTTGTTPEAAGELIVSTSTPQPAQGWVRPDKIFGLVHVAKTGGTTLSGDLPLQVRTYKNMTCDITCSYIGIPRNHHHSFISSPVRTRVRQQRILLRCLQTQ